jgi:FixJ family two-component response regulator
MHMTGPDQTILVVDDDASIRRSLTRLLHAEGYTAEAVASGEALLERLSAATPSCIILDLGLPGLDGLALQRLLKERHIHIPIVFISGCIDVPGSVRAMKDGAEDVLMKPFKAEALVAAIESALARQEHLRQADEHCQEVRKRADALSPREREVMLLVVKGLLNKQSGKMLGVTEKTIKAHRAQVMRKMQAHSLADLVRMAECLN